MTQPLRELLDDAVAGVEPGSRDPVASVMGRHRAARRRRVVAGAVACVLAVAAAGGALAASRHTVNRPLPPVGVVPAEPPTPRVVDGVIVAGALRLPIPDGWRVTARGSGEQCPPWDNEVMIHRVGAADCSTSSIRVSAVRTNAYPVGSILEAPGDDVFTPLPLFTLRGGEPALVGEHAFTTSQTTMVLPWSRVEVDFYLDGPASRAIVDTITTEPTGSGRLNLPASVRSADFTRPDASGKFTLASHGRITDAATIGKVTSLLRDQRKVVSPEDACAAPDDPGALLIADAFIVVTLGEDCQEAFSDQGGRVKLSDSAVRELTRLFGIEVR
ncbi:hypothetical protein JIG36_02800 [Actinoplanes sp. LDG1-06]|uniref:Uncharacterized protein n=1 Tax=Paractinoplanes ovalisporus TaxID=2810368 RepID=A0ABS2A3R9_9ACTN|nr:hypothetical protein [Actinoplanes ovalisporus]MBM2614488.1 hypothetical protein [Actinoplanes ovalisporus]